MRPIRNGELPLRPETLVTKMESDSPEEPVPDELAWAEKPRAARTDET